MNKYTERIYNGIVKENPTFILMLGMCPTLAVSTSAYNGIGMGIATMAVGDLGDDSIKRSAAFTACSKCPMW